MSDLTTHIRIPRPHVPFGPKDTPELLADADYLDHAARNIRGGYKVGGSNVTETVINLLHDAATALRQEHERTTNRGLHEAKDGPDYRCGAAQATAAQIDSAGEPWSDVEIDPPYEVTYLDGHSDTFVPIRVTNVAGVVDSTVINAATARALANALVVMSAPATIEADDAAPATVAATIGRGLYGRSYAEAHDEHSFWPHIAEEQDQKIQKVLTALAADGFSIARSGEAPYA